MVGEKGEGEGWWVRREREKCGGREGRGRRVVGQKGEGEGWWARREREKCGSGEDD